MSQITYVLSCRSKGEGLSSSLVDHSEGSIRSSRGGSYLSNVANPMIWIEADIP
jgi:hypothetical protein